MDGFEGIYEDLPLSWFMSSGGKPARVLGTKGWPSFEHEDGKMLVYDLLVVQAGGGGSLQAFPRWYGTACVLATDDMVPLHHNPGAWWEYRPCIYTKHAFDGWLAMGSQQELGWRRALAEVMEQRADAVEKAIEAIRAGESMEDFADRMMAEAAWPIEEADARAAAILRENLNPQQRIEMASLGKFRVVGGKTDNVYEIEPGNGFAIVDAITGETVVSYCLHPEEWIPHDDVALATKFALEDPELEVECLENAQQVVLTPVEPRTPELQHAWRVERDMELVSA